MQYKLLRIPTKEEADQMAIYTSRSPRTNPGSGRVEGLNQEIQRTSSPHSSTCLSACLSVCLSVRRSILSSQSVIESVNQQVRSSVRCDSVSSLSIYDMPSPFAFLKNQFDFFYSFFIVSYCRMYDTMSYTTINQLLQIPYSLLKNSLTFQQIGNFC